MLKHVVRRAAVALSAAAIVLPLMAGTATADTPTANLVAYIQSSQGNAPLAGSFQYYDGGWQNMPMYDSTTGRVNLPVGKQVPVRATYEGTTDQKTVTIGENGSGVWFHTSKVNVMVQAHDNSILDLADGSASYYAGGWHAMTGVNANNPAIRQAEMLPGTYSFAATYNGTRDQKTQTIVERNVNDYNNATNNANQTVYFHTSLVTSNLTNHKDAPLGGGTASYYAGNAWRVLSNAGVEMLPGSYSFAEVYNGTRQQQQYTVIETNPNNGANAMQAVNFKTTLVNVQASDHTITTGSNIVLADASYYAGGWYAMTIVNANNPKMRQAEMLPGTYSFADVYNGARQQKNGVVIGNGPIQSVYFGF